MPHPCPHHCPPGNGGGGGILAAAAGILAPVLIGAAIARPVIHAAEIALQIVLITCGVLAAAAVTTGAVVIAVRIRRRQLAARPPVRLVSSRPVQAIAALRQRAIGAPAHHRARPQPAERPTVQVRRLP